MRNQDIFPPCQQSLRSPQSPEEVPVHFLFSACNHPNFRISWQITYVCGLSLWVILHISDCLAVLLPSHIYIVIFFLQVIFWPCLLLLNCVMTCLKLLFWIWIKISLCVTLSLSTMLHIMSVQYY